MQASTASKDIRVSLTKSARTEADLLQSMQKIMYENLRPAEFLRQQTNLLLLSEREPILTKSSSKDIRAAEEKANLIMRNLEERPNAKRLTLP